MDRLPEALILNMFKKLPPKDLYQVQMVCSQWRRIAFSPILWKVIDANAEVPTKVLKQLIQNAHLLEELILQDRKDVDEILCLVAEYPSNLKVLKLFNCWGTNDCQNIAHSGLIKMVKVCPMLCTFHFDQCLEEVSLDFLRILSRKEGASIYFREVRVII
ncbi:F-box/LRR-repeat protein 7-like isoform X5 [Aethina tumida]|uniref:F-box/LRR-repeat protein 7-like isoform X5 n=1 Tax=Aethina tumida TaxID=116153 RepID=UPI00214882F3|nr:F-box/LRR-repeat protein 7-like isoform X5 [Aethina tumida]